MYRAFQHVLSVYSSGTELLRHFWATSADLSTREKVGRCHEIIGHLEEIEGRVNQYQTAEGKQLLAKMLASIEKARVYLRDK